MTTAQLERQERDAFLDWRRSLAQWGGSVYSILLAFFLIDFKAIWRTGSSPDSFWTKHWSLATTLACSRTVTSHRSNCRCPKSFAIQMWRSRIVYTRYRRSWRRKRDSYEKLSKEKLAINQQGWSLDTRTKVNSINFCIWEIWFPYEI